MPTVQGNNPGNCPKFPLQSSKKEEAPPERRFERRFSDQYLLIVSECTPGPRPNIRPHLQVLKRVAVENDDARGAFAVSLAAGEQGQILDALRKCHIRSRHRMLIWVRPPCRWASAFRRGGR